jgi:hypothetical protein
MNEKIKEIATQAGASFNEGFYKDVVGIVMSTKDLEKFAELFLKESFTIIKESMVGEDMTVVEEIISDRLDDAAGDVCDDFGLLGPIYEG